MEAHAVQGGTFLSFMAEGTLLYQRGEYEKALIYLNNVRRGGAGGWGRQEGTQGHRGGRRWHSEVVASQNPRM